jgi:hypothetical protein
VSETEGRPAKSAEDVEVWSLSRQGQCRRG